VSLNKVVQRSLSTRLKFVTEAGPGKVPVTPPPEGSSKEYTTFKFYESADRVPELDQVFCDEPLTEYDDTSGIGYKLADVLTNENSPYKGAIKSIQALPFLPKKPGIGTIERIDLSYHDLHRLSTESSHREKEKEIGGTRFAGKTIIFYVCLSLCPEFIT
jgi:hypothetical protein